MSSLLFPQSEFTFLFMTQSARTSSSWRNPPSSSSSLPCVRACMCACTARLVQPGREGRWCGMSPGSTVNWSCALAQATCPPQPRAPRAPPDPTGHGFLVPSDIPASGRTTVTHSPAEGHLDHVQFLATMNKGAMNTQVQAFVRM